MTDFGTELTALVEKYKDDVQVRGLTLNGDGSWEVTIRAKTRTTVGIPCEPVPVFTPDQLHFIVAEE